MTGRALVAALGLLAAAPVAAHAQVVDPKDYPVERLRLAMDDDGVLDAESGAVPGHGTWGLGLWLGVANNPLVAFTASDGEGGERAGALVTDRVGGSLLFAYAVGGWVEVGLEVPLVLYQDRDTMLSGGGMLSTLSATGIGDLRVAPKLRLLRAPVSLAVIPALTFPTGGDDGYFGERTVTFAPEVALSRDLGAIRLVGNLGYRTRQNSADVGLTVEDELFVRAALGYRVPEGSGPPVDLGVGLTGAVPASAPIGNGNANALELLASVGYQIGPVHLFGGGGVGIEAGYGVPDWRLFVGTRFTREPAVAAPVVPRDHDADDDGVLDASDRCVREPEDRDGFEDDDGCPDLDNDRDGVADGSDACATVAEDADGFEDGDGCPDGDDDGDGIDDDRDSCRLEPEDLDGFQDSDGCAELDNDGDENPDSSDACPGDPEDRDGVEDDDGCPDLDDDGDGLVAPADRCPQQPEVYNDVDDGDGCPDSGAPLVVVTTELIQVKQSIQFEVKRARINKASFKLLNAIAAALIAHTDLRIRVEGHTDDSGGEAFNLELSQKRADAVREYLISKGVDGERLEATGHGETQPKVAGTSKKARDANRRVDFTIVGRAAEAEDAAVPETLPAPQKAPLPEKAPELDPDGLE